ncbi:hypothetical protein, partial [Gilliamella sp. B3372]
KSQINSSNPGRVSTPSLPQTFELVGRDTNGTPVVKYGFTLKQWFVNRGNKGGRSPALSWCNSIGYRLPRVRDLTNASCPNNDSECQGSVGASPSSPTKFYMRHIGSGFLTEWGRMYNYYTDLGFTTDCYWTSDPTGSSHFSVCTYKGYVVRYDTAFYDLCTYP